MTNTTDISKELDKIIDEFCIPISEQGLVSGNIVTIRAIEAIQALIDRAVTEARQEQVMSDSLVYSLGLNVDESEVLKIRDLILDQLSNTTGAKAGVIDETMQGYTTGEGK